MPMNSPQDALNGADQIFIADLFGQAIGPSANHECLLRLAQHIQAIGLGFQALKFILGLGLGALRDEALGLPGQFNRRGAVLFAKGPRLLVQASNGLECVGHRRMVVRRIISRSRMPASDTAPSSAPKWVSPARSAGDTHLGNK